MRSMRLLAAAVLAVILALSSAQNVHAAPQISLNPIFGPPGTIVTVTGSGFIVSAQPYCNFVSNPAGLVGPTSGTDFVCMIANDGSIGTCVVCSCSRGERVVFGHSYLSFGAGERSSAVYCRRRFS